MNSRSRKGSSLPGLALSGLPACCELCSILLVPILSENAAPQRSVGRASTARKFGEDHVIPLRPETRELPPGLSGNALVEARGKWVVSSASESCYSFCGNGPAKLKGLGVEQIFNTFPNIAEGEGGCFDAIMKGTGRKVRAFWSRLNECVQLLLLDLERACATQEPNAPAFVSMVAHEIRNPLASIKMVVQTLAQGRDLDERTSRRLVIAAREVRAIERILISLSDISRTEARHLDKRPTDLVALVVGAMELVEPDIRESSIKFRIEAQTGLPLVSVDQARVRLALAYLIAYVSRIVNNVDVSAIVIAQGDQGVIIELKGLSANMLGSCPAALPLLMVNNVAKEHGGSFDLEKKTTGASYRLFLPFSEC